MWKIPAVSNAAGPARNTMGARYCSLKQRSSQVSCLMLNFLMYGTLPCYSVIEQILVNNAILRYNTVGPGSEMRGRGSCALPSTDHITRTWQVLPSAGHLSPSVYFAPAPVPRSFLNFALVLSSGSTTL